MRHHHHHHQPPPRCAATLVEVLIAFAILTVLAGVAWTLWTFAARSGTTSAWEAVAEAQLAGAASRLRDVVRGGSYPSFTTPQGTVVLSEDPETGSAVDTYYVLVPPLVNGEALLEADGITAGAQVPVFALYRCRAGRKGVAELSDQAATGSLVEVYLAGAASPPPGGKAVVQLRLRQTALQFGDTADAVQACLRAVPAAAGPPTDSLLVADVRSVGVHVVHRNPETGSLEAVTATVADRCSLSLDITCLEPVRAQTTRVKSVALESNTGVTPAAGG